MRKVAGSEPVRLDPARGRYACTPGADWRSELAEQTSRSARGLLRDLESWAADRGEHGVITARGYQQVAAGDRNTHRQMAELLKASVVHRTPDGGFKLAFWERNNRYRRDAECFREVNVSRPASEIIDESIDFLRTQEEEIREREKTLSQRCAGAPLEAPPLPEPAEPEPKAGGARESSPPQDPRSELPTSEREGPEKAPDTPHPTEPPPELTLTLTEPPERPQRRGQVLPLKKARAPRRRSPFEVARARVVELFNALYTAKYPGRASYPKRFDLLTNATKGYFIDGVLNEQAASASISAFLADDWWTRTRANGDPPGHSLDYWAKSHERYDNIRPKYRIPGYLHGY